jgi:hypothetical protein
VNLKSITLGSRSQIQKGAFHTIPFIWNSTQAKLIYRPEIRIKLLGRDTSQGGGGAIRGVRKLFGCNGNALCFDRGMSHTIFKRLILSM